MNQLEYNGEWMREMLLCAATVGHVDVWRWLISSTVDVGWMVPSMMNGTQSMIYGTQWMYGTQYMMYGTQSTDCSIPQPSATPHMIAWLFIIKRGMSYLETFETMNRMIFFWNYENSLFWKNEKNEFILKIWKKWFLFWKYENNGFILKLWKWVYSKRMSLLWNYEKNEFIVKLWKEWVYSFKMVVLTKISVTAYGSQLEDGRLSSK